MSMIIPFLKSCLFGLAIAAPVGPIGMLCIRHSLISGVRFGLAIGLGAALADSVYGLIVGGGMTIISSFLLDSEIYIKTIGGILLLYLAFREVKSKVTIEERSDKTSELGVASLILSTFVLTLSNPMTIMSFIGIFSSNLANSFSSYNVLILVIGIFCGSMFWWVLLSRIAFFSKKFISIEILSRIKYFSAMILSMFGIEAILSGLVKY